MAKSSVRWKKFHTNITEYIKHENNSVNVTLACDGNQHIKAHKIILSSGSLFFRDILANAKHPEPFIFLSGIRKCELESIVEFLYSGETSVANNDLDRFLEIALLLQIQGVGNFEFDDTMENLTREDKETEANHADDEIKKNLANNLDEVKDATNHDSMVGEIDLEGIEEDAYYDKKGETDDNLELNEKEASPIDIMLPKIVYGENNDSKLDITDELRSQTDKLMEKVDGLWECTKCSKTFLLKGLARKHTEFHLTNTIYACNLCTKTVRTRSGLWEHVRYVHKDQDASFVCSGCGKTGMKQKQFKNHKYLCRKYKAQL
jgi:rubrerythrin